MIDSLPHKQGGVTLVEVIITIVVLSVGVAGIMNVLWQTATYSADPMQRQQALNIAQSYMEEIIAKHYADPNLAPPGASCGLLDGTRTSYNDICDYSQLTAQVPTDVSNTAIAGLGGYTVELNFDNTTETLGPAGGSQLTAAANQLIWIEVIVTPPGGGDPVTISSYRTPHF